MGLIGDVETVAEGATGTWWIKLIPYVLSVAVACGLLYGAYSWAWHRGAHSRDGEVSALNLTISNVRTAEAQATSANLAHVRDVETKSAAIQKEASDAIASQSDAVHAALVAYIVRHPAQADPGHASASGVSGAAPAAGTVAAADPQTVVPASDLDACADAYVIATGWQEWWAKVSIPAANSTTTYQAPPGH